MTGEEEGTFEVLVRCGDIESNTLTISVIDITAREEALAAAEAQKQAALEAAEQARKEAEAQKLAKEQAEREAEEKRLAEERAAQQKATEEAASVQVQESASAGPSEPSSGSSNSSGNGENFNTYDNVEQQQTTASYVLNTNTHKFHYPSCRSVKKISPENYSTSNSSRDELISQGYDSCGICKP